MMTIHEYMETREKDTYGKRIRILDQKTHKSYGPWWENPHAIIKEIKVTAKYIFIFIQGVIIIWV